MADQVKNFAYSTTAAAVTAGATSFSVASGTGSRFPATSGGAYNLVVWNPKYRNASVAYQNSAAEIIRVTTLATDTFSVITRAQESTSAIAWEANWRVELNVTGKSFEEASASLSGIVSTSAQTFAGEKTAKDGLVVGLAETTTGTVKFKNGNDSYTATLSGPAGLSGDITYTLPGTTGTIALGTSIKYATSFLVSSNFGADATNYCGWGGSLSTSETGQVRVPVGVTGTVVGFYVQAAANTISNTTTITLRSGAADASSLSDSNVVASLATTVKNGSDTSNTLAVTPTMILGLKFVSAGGGTGTMTGIGVTIVIQLS